MSSSFLWKYPMLQLCKMTEGWNRSVDMHTLCDFHYFPGTLNCPMFYLKVSNTSPLVSVNFVWVFFPTFCMNSEPPDVTVSRFWFHLVLCISFAARRHSSQGVVFLWSIIRGYQHNTSLNTLEHIPCNPQSSIIRGSWASYHCDHTNTYHWSAKVSGSKRGREERGREGWKGLGE